MRIGGVKQLVAQPIHRIEVRSSGELQPQPRQNLCQGGPMYKHAYQVLTALMFLAWLLVPRFGVIASGAAFFGLYVWHSVLIYLIVRRLSGFRWSIANLKLGMLFLPACGIIFAM